MKAIKQFLKLEKKDKLFFFLICGSISNLFVGIIKFIFAITIPSLWFFINSIFSFVLAMSRMIIINNYNKIKKIDDERIRIIKEQESYLQNGVMLILLGIVYFFVSSYMYYNGTNTNMHEYITYLIALIAFPSWLRASA